MAKRKRVTFKTKNGRTSFLKNWKVKKPKVIEISTEKGERDIVIEPTREEIIISRKYKSDFVEVSPRQFKEIAKILKRKGII